MTAREEKVQNFRRTLMDVRNYNRPVVCPECGGIMVFKGVGEYVCEDCRYSEYDDYGKVRNYLEKHEGATAAQVAAETGVTQHAIRDMLKESRLEIAANSKAFLKCERCGGSIRSGRLCPRCEINYHRDIENEIRQQRSANVSGFSLERPNTEDGLKRFKRTK